MTIKFGEDEKRYRLDNLGKLVEVEDEEQEVKDAPVEEPVVEKAEEPVAEKPAEPEKKTRRSRRRK